MHRRLLLLLALTLLTSLPSRSAADTVSVLTIGNSFAENALRFLPQLAEAAGHELIVGRANLGGCSLERHWNHVAAFEKDPNSADGSPYEKGTRSLHDLLTSRNWDFITLQQLSIKSHDLSTYTPFAENLCAYVRKYAPDSKLLVQQIWAYRVDDPRFVPKNAGKEPHTHLEMYQQVRAAYHTLAEELDLEIIPSGDAMFLADTDPKWGFQPDPAFNPKTAVYPALPDQSHSLHVGWTWRKLSDDAKPALRLDGHHANRTGEYLIGCVWFEKLFGQSVVDNAFVPEGIDANDARFLRETAHQAVAKLSPTQTEAGTTR
ncbi:MAG: DUF4886 domain-containing protein [Verrucomicrobiales bacterium]|nr:DUF4886 domain-containing protein [Verrucomicrobiales bacterium]